MGKLVLWLQDGKSTDINESEGSHRPIRGSEKRRSVSYVGRCKCSLDRDVLQPEEVRVF